MVAYRLNRLFSARSGRCLNVAMDHGLYNELSFFAGVEDLESAVDSVVEAGPDAIQLSVGQARHLQKREGRTKPSLMLRVDVSNAFGRELPRAMFCRMIGSPVEEALRLDAVCVVLNLLDIPGQPELADQCIQNILAIRPDCERYGMPLMVEAVVFRANEGAGGFAVDGAKNKIIPLVRQAAELGADVVKADATDDPTEYNEVVKAAGVPVLVRGGGKAPDDEILARTAALMHEGIRGIVYGRNIIQHRSPDVMTRALMAIVHEGASPLEAKKQLL